MKTARCNMILTEETAKKLLKIDKYKNLTVEKILLFNRRKIIEQARFM